MRTTMLSMMLCAMAAGQALTVDWVMKGPALYGYAPRAVRWSGDGQRVYFEWKQAGEGREAEYGTYVAGRDGTGLRRLSEEEARVAPPATGDETRDKAMVVVSEKGDVVVYDRRTGARRQLTRTTEAEMAPRFTGDGKGVTFVRGGNLYLMGLESGTIEQLTDVRAGGAPEKKGTESQEALKKGERGLLEVVGARAKKREEDEAKKKKENPRKEWKLAGRQAVTMMVAAPDGRHVLAMVSEPAGDAKTTVVPNYVTESGYAETVASRGKVGDVQGRPRMAIVEVATGEVRWVDAGMKEREVMFGQGRWSEDGKRLAVLGRSADSKERWVFGVDVETGKARALFHLKDEAWVGGPGSGVLGWMPDGERVYFQAEVTGWSHLYVVGWSGGEARALTSGAWEVETAVLAEDKKSFLLVTSEAGHERRDVYRMGLEGGARERLTTALGDYEVTEAPDGATLALIHGKMNEPPELYLMGTNGGAMKRVTVSPSAEFSARKWVDAPIVKVPARDGAMVPARLYKPAGWKKGGPAVLFVHGAGYLQNAHKWWSSYAREYMFHHLLMERGFLVLDADYRGSAGYGRDWRTAIYRHMGGKDLDDYVDAAAWVVKEYGVDAKRIGIYGGSYGGFLTLMGLFTQPKVFAAGAALRPVTDWAHYNHGYTGSILNLPQKDQEAYRRSSPIYHAAGLEGALLICHGMVDVNVHFQDTVRLVQKLIELRKENWEAAMYPAEDHGFVEETSWADEYKRILKLFEEKLRR